MIDEQALILLEQQVRQEARKDFLKFLLYCKPDFVVAWYHRYIAKTLNEFVFGDVDYLMIFMPPRHGKSEMVSRHLPAFIHLNFPDDEIMAASYNDSLAGDMCMDVQKVMDSPPFREICPEVRIPPPKVSYTKGIRNSEEHHIVGKKGKYRGQGVGGSFTGKGANWIIVDDPIKGRETADSAAFRERLWNFWNNDLFTRRETDLKTGRKAKALITLTRWHEDDLAGRLLENMKKDPKAVKWKVILFPAIKMDNDNPNDPRDIGQALWPIKFNIEELNQIKSSIGDRAWGSLYQQDPTPIGGAVFSPRMFKYGKIPETFDYTFIIADTAYKDKQENDFQVFTHFGVVNKQMYVIKVYRKQIKAAELEDSVRPFVESSLDYGFRALLIEPKGHGIYLNQKWAQKGYMIPSEDFLAEFFKDRKFDKVERANNIIGHLAYRYIIINEEIEDKEDLVRQCTSFPKVAHDDFVDTIIDGVKYVYGNEISMFDLL